MFEHDLFRTPVSTFPDHALASRFHHANMKQAHNAGPWRHFVLGEATGRAALTNGGGDDAIRDGDANDDDASRASDDDGAPTALRSSPASYPPEPPWPHPDYSTTTPAPAELEPRAQDMRRPRQGPELSLRSSINPPSMTECHVSAARPERVVATQADSGMSDVNGD